MGSSLTSYDQVPYTNHAFPETHIARLRAAALLHGVAAPEVSTARVLELGCGMGGNLTPMAYAYPQGRFVGIDLSARQIGEAARFASEAGVENVRYQPLSITEISREFGEFDYILCHGVFSWVPEGVREKILDVCRGNLSPAGVAFVSLNTYPGWHARQYVRDAMLYHTRGVTDPAEKVARAKALLELLAARLKEEASPMAAAIGHELKLVQGKADTYVLHEYLEDCNRAMYFREFVAMVEGRGLQYLADAKQNGGLDGGDERVRRVVGTMPSPAPAPANVVEAEQYADLLSNRGFRRALLCRGELRIDRAGLGRRMEEMAVVSPLRADGEVPLTAGKLAVFAHPRGGGLQSEVPLVKGAFARLQEAFPMPMAVEALWREAAKAAGLREGAAAEQRRTLLEELVQCWRLDLVEVHASPVPFVTTITDRPEVSRMARCQAAKGEPVTTLRHETVELDEAYRNVIQCIDGTRTVREMARHLRQQGYAVTEEQMGVMLRQLAGRGLLRG